MCKSARHLGDWVIMNPVIVQAPFRSFNHWVDEEIENDYQAEQYTHPSLLELVSAACLCVVLDQCLFF